VSGPRAGSVLRLDLGYFLRPGAEYGGAAPRVEPVYAYLVRRERGLILFDTGIGEADAGTEAHYRPRRRPLRQALHAVGVDAAEVDMVVNCHLHFDHCGGNPQFAGTPILTQAAELRAARAGRYTIDELVDFDGVVYEEADGEVELWPGVWIIPTPGHSEGHQSLVVMHPNGTLVLAGQAHDFASEFASAALARRAVFEWVAEPLPEFRPWLGRLLDFDPKRVVFAHDAAIWEPM
jgi:N-acyl homoserine lactone hydrolase